MRSGKDLQPHHQGVGLIAPKQNARQDELNVDATTGKSINALRAFAGKGTLVWGARTLAGNDNEWRYVPVRRFFNMVEESVKKSTYWAVFEPNDANTWVKVRGMIENYLTQKWREGALAATTAGGGAESGKIVAVQRSLIFRFPDTIWIEIVPRGDHAGIAIYSRSTYGRFDFGVNRARVEALLAAIGRAASP